MDERRTELLGREKHMMMREGQLTFHIEAILNCFGGKLPEEQCLPGSFSLPLLKIWPLCE